MINLTISQFLLTIIFLTIVFLHIAKKNTGAAFAYGLQSLIIVVLIVNSYFETGYVSLLFVGLITLAIKVILAPMFFVRLIKRHKFNFSVSTYLNTPFTLIAVTALTVLAYSKKLAPITGIVPEYRLILALALSTIFISLLLIINRKGALSQIIGILSLENSVVAFAIFAGLEQSPGLQIGVLFVMLIWMIVATAFISMIYRHFGSLDVTAMDHLKD